MNTIKIKFHVVNGWYLEVNDLVWCYYDTEQDATDERDLLVKTNDTLDKIRDFIDAEFAQLDEHEVAHLIRHTMGKLELRDFIVVN